ncbi:vacuolar protein sorting/targeting protein PEP1 [Modicella reniformis]|uniref:Vacuolar protein sorting/targeting protein PEP1 n=1 Tax=Modicella reniformis TaxID=1440133 RepID=A0A9P6MJD0_9FUNG|nr:vacuolar protein sorting/targeting protein PEP1 [Modicella reniformis]
MGVGNVGKYLLLVDSAQTYLSRDAGKTWKKVNDRRCLYEFGDEGGVLVMVDPFAPTREASYSYDFGSTWQKTTFVEAPMLIQSVTTEPTSHTSKITVTGTYINGNQQYVASTMDFGNRHDCVLDKNNADKSDIEKWSPFEGEDDRCILGREILYWRRKLDKTCRVNDSDGVPDMEQTKCKCTAKDFECDIGFFRDKDGSCKRFGHDPDNPRSVTGHTWVKPASARSQLVPVVLLKLETHVYMSKNKGKDWDELKTDGIVTGLHRHPHDRTRAVVGTSGRKQYLTIDRGVNWDEIELPLASAATSFSANPWSFHPTEPDWMIFLGETGCNFDRDNHCHIEAFYSLDAGKRWQSLATWVRSCSWVRDKQFAKVSMTGIYCEEYDDKSGSQRTLMGAGVPVRFVYTDNFMKSSPKVLFDAVVGYAIYSDYLIAAEYVPSQSALRVAVSMDGINFKQVRYPHGVDVVNPAFTVSDSTTRSVFMAINVIDRQAAKTGNLFTSDSNGTHFSLSKKYVSESDFGNVDFEKMQGIDGVALLNEVTNANEANQGKRKQLRSMITMDNGHSWDPLNPPKADSDNQLYDCQSPDCSLHLHNYLDRKHVEDMLSSPSVAGTVIGIGNYDFGDHGSIILLIKDDERPTDHVIYSLDHGRTFQEFEFSVEKVIIKDIVTKPGGIGKSFLLFALPQPGGSNFAKQLIYQIDFQGLDFPACRLDLNDENNDDFDRWSLAGLRKEKCMFGRNVEYYRRIEDRKCFVGELATNPGYIEGKCPCTDKDFECDFNYEPDGHGKCLLIEGAKPLTFEEKEICASLPEGQDFYYESIGYRKMAFSSCVGEHDLLGNKKYCPGKGGIGFFGWVGILLASGGGAYALIWVLNKYRTSRGSFIRLGNDVYDQIPLPRTSSLPSMSVPSMRVPRSFSRSLGRLRVPDVAYQAWGKISALASAVVPRRLRRYFGGGGGYRYQNLNQEPGEVIMDDYFDNYLDDDDDENTAGTTGSDGLLSHEDGLQDAQERFRDDSDDEDLDLNRMV